MYQFFFQNIFFYISFRLASGRILATMHFTFHSTRDYSHILAIFFSQALLGDKAVCILSSIGMCAHFHIWDFLHLEVSTFVSLIAWTSCFTGSSSPVLETQTCTYTHKHITVSSLFFFFEEYRAATGLFVTLAFTAHNVRRNKMRWRAKQNGTAKISLVVLIQNTKTKVEM